jgi:hypothetical protein
VARRIARAGSAGRTALAGGFGGEGVDPMHGETHRPGDAFADVPHGGEHAEGDDDDRDGSGVELRVV